MAVTGASAKAPARSDDEIRNSVLLELKWDPFWDFSVQPLCSLWCGFTRNSSTTETQRTQRLHREERDRDFLCKAAPGVTKVENHITISP